MTKEEEIDAAWLMHGWRGRGLSIIQAREQLERAHAAQGGLCYYCQRRAPLPSAEVGRADLGHRAATREHLRRKADGGSDHDSNIVMACAGCNSGRGDRSPEFWRQTMQAFGRVEQSERESA